MSHQQISPKKRTCTGLPNVNLIGLYIVLWLWPYQDLLIEFFWQRSSPLQGETASWKVMRERVNDIVLNSYAVVAVWEVILKYCFNSVPQGWPIHLMKYVANNLFWIWLANQADNCVLRDIELSAKIHLLSFI